MWVQLTTLLVGRHSDDPIPSDSSGTSNVRSQRHPNRHVYMYTNRPDAAVDTKCIYEQGKSNLIFAHTVDVNCRLPPSKTGIYQFTTSPEILMARGGCRWRASRLGVNLRTKTVFRSVPGPSRVGIGVEILTLNVD